MTADGLAVESVVTGLSQPTALAFADDAILVTEKASGKVLIVRGDAIVGEAIDLAVNSFDERGLLGIAVHPEFPSQPFVYLHWTWRGEGDSASQLLGADTDAASSVPALGNRIDRFVWQDDTLRFDRNIVELPSNTLEADTSGDVRGNHNAGPVAFGPDGKLYTMLGDQNLRGQLQNITGGPEPDDEHLAGVILRLNDDGTVPEDNPFFNAGADIGGEVGDNIQMIFAYGVRNSFGLAFEPRSGALWQTENGDDSFDEINVFKGGSNSGWIQMQGAPEELNRYKQLEMDSEDGLDVASFPPSRLEDTAQAGEDALFSLPGSSFSPPLISYVHPLALTALGFVDGDQLDPRSGATVWVGTVLTGTLLRYDVADDGRSLVLDGDLADRVVENEENGDLGETEDDVVGTGFGVVTDIEQGADGNVYVVSLDGGALYRIAAER